MSKKSMILLCVGALLSGLLVGCGSLDSIFDGGNTSNNVTTETSSDDVSMNQTESGDNDDSKDAETTSDQAVNQEDETMMTSIGSAAELMKRDVSEYELTGEFKEFTSTDLYGNEVDQDLIKGYDLVMINIWATFCSPCINEMPDIGELANEYADKNVLIVGICADIYSSDDLDTAIEIVTDTGADYPHLLVSEDLLNLYVGNVQAVPTTVFLDSTGTIIGSDIGSKTKAGWEAVLDSYLEQ